MQREGTVSLQVRPRTIADAQSFMVDAARGKSVLNVGAAGGVEGYLPHAPEGWLNHRLSDVARELVAIDIDHDSIEYAARHGVHIEKANCETMDLGRTFDVIVISDVIEHLNAPGAALQRLLSHLAPGGRLFVTTPNPTFYASIVRAALSRDVGMYYDHVSSFMPENLQAMCNRFGGRLVQLYFFGLIDRRTLANKIKSHFARLIGRVAPRLHGSFLAVIER